MSLHPFTKTFWSTSCFLLLTSFLGHLASNDGWLSAETLALKLGIRSVRVAQRFLIEVHDRLPQNYSVSLFEPGGEEVLSFPDLEVSAEK